MLEGVVSKEEYQEINSRFSGKLEAARSAGEALETRRERLLSCKTTLQPWMASFKQFQNIQTLDRKVVVSLVDTVTVYDKDRIEVRLRYQDEINEMVAWAVEQNEIASIHENEVQAV